MQTQETLINFTHDQDGVITSKTLRGENNWVTILQEFVYHLEGCGFIGVRDKVAVDTGEVFTPEEQGWYGPTFDKEDDFQEANRKADLEFMNKL